jgi:hypothetical protein
MGGNHHLAGQLGSDRQDGCGHDKVLASGARSPVAADPSTNPRRGTLRCGNWPLHRYEQVFDATRRRPGPPTTHGTAPGGPFRLMAGELVDRCGICALGCVGSLGLRAG